MPECPECGHELVWDDYFGPHIGGGNIQKVGDIYECQNEDCDSHWFHILKNDTEPREGYPC